MLRPIALAVSAIVAIKPTISPKRTANPSPKMAQKAGDLDQNTYGPIPINMSCILISRFRNNHARPLSENAATATTIIHRRIVIRGSRMGGVPSA